MVPRVGQKIGPYEILGRLGSGGMGLVFSAWDARLQRDVAIKILREEYATPTMRSRFLQEARAASNLNHPNICTVFDIGEVSGDPYLVMELLKGETLRAHITRSGRMAPEEIHRVASEVLDALALAHARGVIHRDIKPANIILVHKPGGGFQAKVLDFGLAKVEMEEHENPAHDLTSIGTTVGTVSYMSPEQARGEPVDARSDLFSLGSVLYEAATGELPFQGATSALIFVELLGKNPPPVRQRNASIPKDLDRFITRLLAKAPSDRFQSATLASEGLQTVSLRKSPFEGITLWASKAARIRPEAGPDTAEVSPGEFPELASTPPASEDAHVLRPARRVVDLFAAPSLPPADRSPTPAGEPANAPLRSSSPAMGDLVIRPFKPEPVRPSTPPRSATEPEANPPAPPRTVSSPAATSNVAAPPATRDLSAATHQTGNPGAGQREPTEPNPRASSAVPVATGPAQTHADVRSPAPLRRRGIRIAVALLIPPAAAALAWYLNVHARTAQLGQPVSLIIAGVQSGPEDTALGSVVSTGLLFSALQSPHLAVRSSEEYAATLRASGNGGAGDIPLEQARDAARANRASILVLGHVRSDGGLYRIALRLVDVATGKQLTEISQTAQSREQLANAIDRLSSAMRTALGEKGETLSRSAVPLGSEASSNADALLAYATGAGLEAAGSDAEAIAAFQHAVSLDAHFAPAWLRLSRLYREEHVELAAARAAGQAKLSAANASSRVQALAKAAVAVNVSGEYGRAAELLTAALATYPDDLQLLNALSNAQFLDGRFAEAQASAERALQLSRFNAEAIGQEELALIAQGRPEAVAAVEARGQSAGVNHRAILALAESASAAGADTLLPSAEHPLPLSLTAGLLDAAGHFSEGAVRWAAMSDAVRDLPDGLSAVAYAQATAGVNRALAGDCNAALSFAAAAQALPSGLLAIFRTGESQALCGNLDAARATLAKLKATYSGKDSAAQAYLVPDLAGTIAWKTGDTAGALRWLESARRFDTVSITGYLRGLVEVSAHQPQLSIVQFQAVLSHRGPAAILAPEVYPLAQLGLARAYAASGDLTNSSVAYGRFLELWSSADPDLAAVAEARSHAHL